MEINEVMRQFSLAGECKNITPLGAGHINTTFLADCGEISYVIQKINTTVFKDAQGLMHNIFAVTDYLKERIKENGGDPMRETLTFVKTKNGGLYYQDENGDCYRAYIFVKDSVCYNAADTPALFARSGAAFGRFQYMLRDFPADTLHETIPHFHDTPWRFHHEFEPAVAEDRYGKACACQEEIRFVNERAGRLSAITDRIADGSIPLRVTHNDTKLNNILFDTYTNEALAVIDLDTVMPGSALYDFGDSIRFGAATAKEDSTNSTVQLDLAYFEAYTKAFLAATGDALNACEKELLAYAAWLITVECGMRFLTDYLNGSIYFKTEYEAHNLDRARNQFRLAADMERKSETMMQIVKQYTASSF